MKRLVGHFGISCVLLISSCASIKEAPTAGTLNLTLCRYIKDSKDSDGGYFRCESEDDSYRVPMGMAAELIAMPFEELRKLLR